MVPSYGRGERLDEVELAIDDPTVETISYEEAMERELEYRKGKNLSLLQSSTSFGSVCAPFQPLSQQPNAGQPLQQAEQYTQPLQHLLLQGPTASGQLKRGQTTIREEYKKPSLQQSHLSVSSQSQQTLGQGQHCRPPNPHLSCNPQNLPHNSRPHLSPFWCNFCKIECGSAINFKSHRQGKRHRSRVLDLSPTLTSPQMVYQNRMLWCNDCKVPCTDEMSLASHFAGKKHADTVKGLLAKNCAAGVWRV